MPIKKIRKDDLYSRSSEVVNLLSKLSDESKRLYAEAERLSKLDSMLSYAISDGQITNIEEVSKAVELAFTTSLPAVAILHQIKEP